MELGIHGRTALVCASSAGLGFACAGALARAGANIVINGRSEATLMQAAESLRSMGARRVDSVVADLSLHEDRQRLLAACPSPDILVTNNGGPAPRPDALLDRASLLEAVEMNFIAAAELISAVLPGMVEREFGRIVNITSAAVRAPLTNLTASSAARAGLTAFSACLARSCAAHDVTINNLEPGLFATGRILELTREHALATEALDAAQARLNARIPAQRFGKPDELGELCAFLCSTHAGYITGQSLLIDGGLVGCVR